MKKSLVLTSSLFFLLSLSLTAQTVEIEEDLYPSGIPFIENIPVTEHSTYTRNWSMVQDKSGLLYFGTNGTLSIYDGGNWIHRYIKNGAIYSMNLASNGRVYVGGKNEMGFVETPESNPDQLHTYNSISIRYYDQFEENPGNIWQTLESGGFTYFRSSQYLLRWDGEIFHRWIADETFGTAHSTGDSLYIHVRDFGLSVVKNNDIVLVRDGERFKDNRIFGIEPYGENELIIFTIHDGIFIYGENGIEELESEATQYLSDHRLYKSARLYDGSYVLGTLEKGIIRIDRNGNVLSIIDRQNGLAEDIVFFLFVDMNGSLYALHDESVSKIDFNIPIRIMDERSGVYGLVEDMTDYQEYIYTATTDGVFYRPRSSINQRFRPLDSNLSLCTSLQKLKDQLFIACDYNIYSWDGSELLPVSDIERTILLESSPSDDRILYVLHAQFLSLGVIEENQTQFHRIDPLSGYDFTGLIQRENGSLLIATQQGVIVKTNLNSLLKYIESGSEPEVEIIRVVDTDRREQTINIFKLDGKPLIADNQQAYRLDDSSNELIQFQDFGDDFFSPGRQIYDLHQDSRGHVWLRSRRSEQVFLKQSDGSYQMQIGVLERIRDRHINSIRTLSDEGVFYGGSRGIYKYYDGLDHHFTNVFQAMIRDVYVRRDSLVFSGVVGPGTNPHQLEFNYSDNELRFRYTSTSYDLPDQNNFQVKLEGFDDDWSSWSSDKMKEYTNIPEGDYEFQVRSRDLYGTVSEAVVFSFKVLPPWYRTWWAYLFYVISITGILYTVHKIRINRILEIQRVRNRIASDLHDEVSATLSSISFFAEALQRKKGSEENEKRFIELISNSTGDAKEKITDIIWSIDPENDDWSNLLAKCRRFASDLLESKEIGYDLDIVEDIPKKIEVELRQHLWLIFKEMITNAARHSGADFVSVKLQYENGLILLEVEDNGDGFDPKSVVEGNGLGNIHKRAGVIGASVELNTGSEGTKWKLEKRF